jgi:protein-S-isoprenylcysteine O-methyltransferase Ste14
LFVTGFGLGALLSRAWPIAAPWGDGAPVSWVGLMLLIQGFALMLTGIVTFRRAKVAVYPNRPARSLVTHGVYAYTRNPMYVGLTTAYVGGVLLTGLVWSLLLLPVVIALLVVLVIRREERHLRERFPVEYAEYCGRVRRWI